MTFTKDFDTVLKMKFKQLNIRIIYDFDDVAKNIDKDHPFDIEKERKDVVENELKDAVTRYLDELTYKNQTYVLGGYPVLYAKTFKGTRDICFTFTPLSLNENDAQPLNGLHYPPGVRGAFPNQYPNNPFTTWSNNAWMA